MKLNFLDKLPPKYRKFAPYLLVIISFFIAIILLIILIDSVIMPALILDRNTVQVPNVTGIDYSKAEQMLKDKNLVINKVNEQFSALVPKGYIINQTPKPYQLVKEGRSIYLTVSKGQDVVSVPYLIGKPIRNARVELLNKGLNLGNVEYVYSEVYGKDTILQQKMQSGQGLSFGSLIDVVVSKGTEAQVTVPNLSGADLDEVATRLSESGLSVGVINYEDNSTYMPNTVFDQEPKPGNLARKGTSVNIKISR